MAKRKNGEGSWGTKNIKGVTYHYFRSGDGKYTYAQTMKELKEKLKKATAATTIKKTDTFKMYCLHWLRNVKALELEARTYDDYESIIECRIGEHRIGNRQLASFNSDVWQAYINELSAKYALGTIKKTWNLIKMIVSYAEVKGDIPVGTLRLVKLPKEANVAVKAKEIPYINQSDMNLLYEEAFKTIGPNNRYVYGDAARLIALILYTGLRVSEACALKWQDVDLVNNKIHIVSSISRVKKRKDNKEVVQNEDGTAQYQNITKAPKTTNSIRELPLHSKAVSVLKYFYEQNPNPKSSDYVCLTKEKKPYQRRNVERCLSSMLKHSNCSRNDYTPHSLRHGYGSVLISKGKDIKVVSKLLGHSDVTFTYNIYIGVFKEDLKNAVEALE